MKSRVRRSCSRRQRGITLVVGLVMLLLVTMIGLAAARFSVLDQLSARASRDRELALQAAEAALRDAMVDIESGVRAAAFSSAPTGFEDDCPAVALPADAATAADNRRGLCLAREPTEPRQLWQDVDLNTRAVPFGTFSRRPWDESVAPAPRYLVESMPLRRAGTAVQGSGDEVEQLAFRITAVGFGPADSDVQVALQSFYVKTR